MTHYYYMCDFETTLDVPTRVWLWSITNIKTGKVVKNGATIEEFIEYISNRWCVCYFHNLKFDGEFILYYLLHNNFVYVDDKPSCNHQFSTLIDGVGTWYAIYIIFKDKEVKILDSLKLLPFPVKKIGKDFGLDVCKGEIDFEEAKRDNYKITDERLDYVNRDTLVVAKALKLCYFDYKQLRMTIGSNALKIYQDEYCQAYFDYLFPQLPSEVDAFCRMAYHGGYCYVSPKYQNTWVGDGQVFDVNSLYPYAMTLDLPYGEPIYFEGEYVKNSVYPLYIIEFSCCFKLKKGYVPIVQLKKNLRFNPVDYVEECDEEVVMVMTSVDYEMFREHYEVYKLKVNGGYMFKKSNTLFTKYVNHFMEEKATTTGAKRQRAKLYLNNLYGKMATSPRNICKHPVLVNGEVKYERFIGEDKDTIYIPVGAFVTANAKRVSVNAIQSNIDRFLYCDTDSIHILGKEPPSNIIVHDSDLGAWKKEKSFEKAKFIKPKTYVEIENGKIDIKACGMPDNIKEDFISGKIPVDNFRIGFTSDKKLIPKRVEGGVILQPTSFTIN